MLKDVSPFASRPRTRLVPLATTLVLVALITATAACKSDKAQEPSGIRMTTAASTSPKVISGDPYLITFSIDSPAGEVGALQFEVQPKASEGGFATDGNKVECDSLIGEALSAFSSHPDGKLVGALVDVGGFETPIDVARCTYLSADVVAADGFEIRVTDASNIKAIALVPSPSLVVSKVERVE